MTNFEKVALQAKVKCANAYLDRLKKNGQKIDIDTVLTMVTPGMMEHIYIIMPDVADQTGMDIIQIRSVA